jgi:hypothetical protein
VEEFIRAERRITIDNAATAVGWSYGLAYSTIHDRFKFRKMCTRWVPKELKDREKINRMGLSLQHLLRYANEGEDMINKIVTGDESWARHYQYESKLASVQWIQPSSPSTKKFKVPPTVGKVFWDSQGVLLTHFQKSSENANYAMYCEVLLKLQDAIRRKRPSQLANGVGTASSWQCQTPQSLSNPGQNSRTTAGTCTSSLQPGLHP